jgi:ribosomal protein S18 acetylase RimI-like enzyme
MTAGLAFEVRPVRRRDVREVAAVMARAFDDDPLMVWVLPDEQERVRRLPPLFALMLRHQHLRLGGARLCAGQDGVCGAAFWDPPGAWRSSQWRDLLALPTYLRVLGRRFDIAASALSALYAKHPEDPHWYLAGIGTDPPMQRRGVGGRLLRDRLDACDQAGQAAYLESSKDINVPYYERFGFVVRREIVIPGGGPTTWAMWREPGAG